MSNLIQHLIWSINMLWRTRIILEMHQKSYGTNTHWFNVFLVNMKCKQCTPCCLINGGSLRTRWNSDPGFGVIYHDSEHLKSICIWSYFQLNLAFMISKHSGWTIRLTWLYSLQCFEWAPPLFDSEHPSFWEVPPLKANETTVLWMLCFRFLRQEK